MSFLDEFSDHEFDIEESIIELEENNNLFAEAKHSQNVQNLINQGSQIYDQRGDKKFQKFLRSKRSKNLRDSRQLALDNLDYYDSQLDRDIDLYAGPASKDTRKAMSKEIKTNMAPLVAEISRVKNQMEQLKEMKKRELRQSVEPVSVINARYAQEELELRKELAMYKKQLKEYKKDRNALSSPLTRKKAFRRVGDAIILNDRDNKREYMNKYLGYDWMDEKNGAAKRANKNVLRRDNDSLTDYEKRAVGIAYTQQSNDAARKQNSNLQKRAVANGYVGPSQIKASDTKSRIQYNLASKGKLPQKQVISNPPQNTVNTQQQNAPTPIQPTQQQTQKGCGVCEFYRLRGAKFCASCGTKL